MRNRFFIIILTTLILAAVGINFVHVYFFKTQRLKLIDKQIGESSVALVNSPVFIKSTENLSTIEEALTNVLEGSRIGKVFVLRDEHSKIIYQSFNVGLLKTDLPTQPEWVEVHTTDEFVRLKNIQLPGSRHLILQVGLVLDRNFLNWEIVDQRVINYVSGIVIAVFGASVLLTLILLSPLRLLISHLSEVTSNLGNLKDVRPLPKQVLKFTEGFWARSDEFSGLVRTTQMLIDRINLNHKITRSWTLQMAHELKTPLAILSAEVESKKKMGLLPEPFAQDAFKEIHQMSDIITQFLDWAELENSQLQKDLHALKIKNMVKSIVSRLDKISPDRIVVNIDSDFSVFANPIHLDLMIMNLLTNALKFSPPSEKVELKIIGHRLEIQDRGLGISKAVLERLGQPFNIGIHSQEGLAGNGLGLAWVSTIAKLYQWDINIYSNGSGTEAVIRFPEQEA